MSDGEVSSGEEHVVLGDERREVRIDVAGGRLTVCFLKRSGFAGIMLASMTVCRKEWRCVHSYRCILKDKRRQIRASGSVNSVAGDSQDAHKGAGNAVDVKGPLKSAVCLFALFAVRFVLVFKGLCCGEFSRGGQNIIMSATFRTVQSQ